MKFITNLFSRNKTLAYLGTGFLVLSIILMILIPFNTNVVLGLNSLVKPLKFSISLWIYSWTMAYIVSYFKNKIIKKRLIFLIVFVMLFEQIVITIQAFRGTLSHFNVSTPVEHFLFNLMGVLITVVTGYTLYFAFKFKNQIDNLPKSKKDGLFYGLVIFVIAGFMGGLMGAILSHNIGDDMGGAGLPFLDWSTKVGDIRVAHFIGIHALQIIPLFAYTVQNKFKEKNSINLIRIFSILYFLLVVYTFVQALYGIPFISF